MPAGVDRNCRSARTCRTGRSIPRGDNAQWRRGPSRGNAGRPPMMPNAATPESTNTHAVEAVVARAVRSSCDAIKLSLHQYQNTTELICAGQYALKNIPQDVATLVSRFVCLSGE